MQFPATPRLFATAFLFFQKCACDNNIVHNDVNQIKLHDKKISGVGGG